MRGLFAGLGHIIFITPPGGTSIGEFLNSRCPGHFQEFEFELWSALFINFTNLVLHEINIKNIHSILLSHYNIV